MYRLARCHMPHPIQLCSCPGLDAFAGLSPMTQLERLYSTCCPAAWPCCPQTVASIIMLGFMLVGGYYVRGIPAWISWIRYLSFVYWGL